MFLCTMTYSVILVNCSSISLYSCCLFHEIKFHPLFLLWHWIIGCPCPWEKELSLRHTEWRQIRILLSTKKMLSLPRECKLMLTVELLHVPFSLCWAFCYQGVLKRNTDLFFWMRNWLTSALYWLELNPAIASMKSLIIKIVGAIIRGPWT